MYNSPAKILKTVFGYDEFRELQAEVIDSILKKNDSVVIMPTGGGKSLCYQIPALIFKGMTIVVSPLISLMKDQVEQLSELGVGAVYLNSSLTQKEYSQNISEIRSGAIKLVYVAPETLMLQRTLDLFAEMKIDCITVDEAHCISEWGHDFRKEYRQIADIRDLFPDAVLVGFTATATPRVQKDIAVSLKMKEHTLFLASFDRKNLYIRVADKTLPEQQVVNFLNKRKGQSGIIYCFSRRQVDELYSDLFSRGFSVLPYHAGLGDKDRKENQEKFIRDDVQIIVATIAFGMGINKPNVRFVIHFDLPKNIEGYYQEIGRAGRDGLHSECLLLFGYGDIRKIKYFIDQKEGQEKRVAEAHLNSMVRYSESYLCRRIPLLSYFGEDYKENNCGMCDNCNRDKSDLVDSTVDAQKFLSCVKRTGEKFGAQHIIDVLRGSKAEKVLKFNHDKLSTYGIGKEKSKEAWLNLSNQFIQHNILERDLEYGALKVTAAGYEALKGDKQIMCKLKPDSFITEGVTVEIGEKDEALFELLKRKRKQIADRLHFPPYVIFSDRTLVELSAIKPTKATALKSIHGIGEVKLQKYGNAFLKVIKDYMSSQSGVELTQKVSRKEEILDEINAGSSLGNIAKKFSVQLDTILNHIYQLTIEGESFDLKPVKALIKVDRRQKEKILKCFDEEGTEKLSPVFDKLEGKVPYLTIKLLRIEYLFRQNITNK